MKWYHVYRKALGMFTEIGRTMYAPDAYAILENWHCGYIAYGNTAHQEIVYRKNVTDEELGG